MIWKEHLAKVREQNPNLSLKDAMKLASQSYNKDTPQLKPEEQAATPGGLLIPKQELPMAPALSPLKLESQAQTEEEKKKVFTKNIVYKEVLL